MTSHRGGSVVLAAVLSASWLFGAAYVGADDEWGVWDWESFVSAPSNPTVGGGESSTGAHDSSGDGDRASGGSGSGGGRATGSHAGGRTFGEGEAAEVPGGTSDHGTATVEEPASVDDEWGGWDWSWDDWVSTGGTGGNGSGGGAVSSSGGSIDVGGATAGETTVEDDSSGTGEGGGPVGDTAGEDTPDVWVPASWSTSTRRRWPVYKRPVSNAGKVLSSKFWSFYYFSMADCLMAFGRFGKHNLSPMEMYDTYCYNRYGHLPMAAAWEADPRNYHNYAPYRYDRSGRENPMLDIRLQRRKLPGPPLSLADPYMARYLMYYYDQYVSVPVTWREGRPCTFTHACVGGNPLVEVWLVPYEIASKWEYGRFVVPPNARSYRRPPMPKVVQVLHYLPRSVARDWIWRPDGDWYVLQPVGTVAEAGWYGHCNGFTAACIMVPEPPPRVVKRFDHEVVLCRLKWEKPYQVPYGGVTYTSADYRLVKTGSRELELLGGHLKALCVASWMRAYCTLEQPRRPGFKYPGRRLDEILGRRYEDEGRRHKREFYEDTYPHNLLVLLFDYIGERKRAVGADVNPGSAVWNMPVVGYSYDRRWLESERAYLFDFRLHCVNYGQAGAWGMRGYTTSVRPLRFKIYLDSRNRVKSSEWVGQRSMTSHPDFIWIPVSNLPPAGDYGENARLKDSVVEEMLRP